MTGWEHWYCWRFVIRSLRGVKVEMSLSFNLSTNTAGRTLAYKTKANFLEDILTISINIKMASKNNHEITMDILSPRSIHKSVYCSTVYNSKILETKCPPPKETG